jgi:hypothetical protein
MADPAPPGYPVAPRSCLTTPQQRGSMRALTTLVIIALATGCSGGSTDPGPYADIAGTYTVRRIGGAAPPLQFYTISPDSTSEMIGGALTLTRDSTWSAHEYLRTTTPGVVKIDTSTAAGVYTRDGITIVFSGPATTSTRGTVAHDTITVTFGLPFVYSR